MEYHRSKHSRLPQKLKLGQLYKIRSRCYNYCIIVKLIRPTQKGFNFLNIKTHKCILRNHLYKSKCENHQDELWLWINTQYEIKEFND